MKAKLKFDLNDHDQNKQLKRCVLSTEMAFVLWEFHKNAYKKLEEEDNEEFNKGVFHAIEYFRDLMDENGININELID